MPRPCKTCEHPRRLEIDSDLMLNKPLTLIAKKYDVAYQSLKRHKASNHHGQDMEKIRAKYIEDKGKKFTSTVEVYDDMLKHYLDNPDIKLGMTFAQVLQVLRDRSTLLGEKESPPRVEIVWGWGLEPEEEFGKEQIKIVTSKREKEDVKPKS